ncbi:MAG: hypothetical protein AAFV07_11470, partial [Bacteroidota bacterium]
QLVDMRILDLNGRTVKKVHDGFLVGTEAGTLIWDGLDDLRRQLPIGPYVLWLRVRDQASGDSQIYRFAIALAAKF